MKSKTQVRILLSVMMIIVSLSLIAAVVDPLLDEPWNTLLIGLFIPGAIQLYKVYKDRGGKIPSKRFLQMLSLIVAGVFVYANKGFVGLPWPAFPVFADDIGVFIGAIIDFGRELTVVVGLAFGAMMGLYEFVLKRCFETVGFAAIEKVHSRARVGFWA